MHALIGTVNSVTAALSSSLLAALAIAEQMRQEQQQRLETAKLELAAEPEFNHTVVNDTVEHAADELVSLMGLRPLQR